MSFWGGGSPQLYYHDCSGRIPGHTTRAPPVGFELETNGFQFYAILIIGRTPAETAEEANYSPFSITGITTCEMSVPKREAAQRKRNIQYTCNDYDLTRFYGQDTGVQNCNSGCSVVLSAIQQLSGILSFPIR